MPMETRENDTPPAGSRSSCKGAQEPPQPFFRLDLAKITGGGWLLMALTLIVLFATIFVGKLIAESLGWRGDRYVLGFCGIAAAGAVFEAGRRLLVRAGFRVTAEMIDSLTASGDFDAHIITEDVI